MTRDEVAARLRAVKGKRVRVTFDDGVTQDVDISSVDDEGFVHSGPDGADPAGFWSRFEGVTRIEDLICTGPAGLKP